MKHVLLWIILGLFAQISIAQTKNFIDQPYLETSAQVDTLVTPNRIYLEIRLQEVDTKGRISVEELELRMASRLQGLGIDLTKQLTVADLSSDFRRYFLRGPEIVKEKAFELLLYDAQSAGRVLFELERIGVSNVRLIKTEFAGMDALQEILKSRAVRKARRQGRVMSDALGQSLGPAIFISDTGFSVYNSMKGRSAGIAMNADASEAGYVSLPADFDKIRAEASVQVKFRLE